MNNFFKYIFSFILLLSVISCEEKISEGDIDNYKKVMDIRLGHLGNALIMQGSPGCAGKGAAARAVTVI